LASASSGNGGDDAVRKYWFIMRSMIS